MKSCILNLGEEYATHVPYYIVQVTSIIWIFIMAKIAFILLDAFYLGDEISVSIEVQFLMLLMLILSVTTCIILISLCVLLYYVKRLYDGGKSD